MTKHNEIPLQLEKPFGPRMVFAKLPIHIIDNMNKYCDNVIAQGDEIRKKHDKSQDLVGHVAEELHCEIGHELFIELGNILYGACSALYNNDFIERGDKNKEIERLNIFGAWFVRSYKGDYNPVHIHTHSDFSCVVYTKVPSSIGETNFRNTKKQYATEGYIDFIFGSNGYCSPSNYSRKPEVGDIYVFPSSLMHTAYPFFGEGERRSFSANMSLQFKNNQKA